MLGRAASARQAISCWGATFAVRVVTDSARAYEGRGSRRVPGIYESSGGRNGY